MRSVKAAMRARRACAQAISRAVGAIMSEVEGVVRDSGEASVGVRDIATYNSSIDDAVRRVVASLAALDEIAVDAASAADLVKDRADGIQSQAFALGDEVRRFKTEATA